MKPIRTTRIVAIFTVLFLAIALYGCGSPASTSSYSLTIEPQDGYQPIYDFISGAKKTIDMTI